MQHCRPGCCASIPRSVLRPCTVGLRRPWLPQGISQGPRRGRRRACTTCLFGRRRGQPQVHVEPAAPAPPPRCAAWLHPCPCPCTQSRNVLPAISSAQACRATMPVLLPCKVVFVSSRYCPKHAQVHTAPVYRQSAVHAPAEPLYPVNTAQCTPEHIQHLCTGSGLVRVCSSLQFLLWGWAWRTGVGMQESMLQILKSQRYSPAPAALKRQALVHGKACSLCLQHVLLLLPRILCESNAPALQLTCDYACSVRICSSRTRWRARSIGRPLRARVKLFPCRRPLS